MRRRLHRDGREHLHEVIDHDVSERPDRIVEVAAVGDAEVLGHGDLHAVDVVAVPHGLEHRVREAQVEDLLEAHLAEVVVDPEDLRLVDVLVQVGGERPSRIEVVAERLLDDDPAVLGETGIREVLHDRREQAGWDLQVEHRGLRVAHRRPDPRIGRIVGEVTLHVAQPRREACEDRLVELFPGGDDRRTSALDELVDRPVIDRDPDDGAVEQSALLEPVERPEGHHPRQVAGDAEHHQDIRVRMCGLRSPPRSAPSFSCRAAISGAPGRGAFRGRDRRGQVARRPLLITGSTTPDPWSSW